jgi:hypothetical protein
MDERRLARAVRAEKAEELAGADVEADPVERQVAAVALADVVDLQGGWRPAHRRVLLRPFIAAR